jgi:hypothetical protein
MQLDNLFESLELEPLAQQCEAIPKQAAKRDLGYRELLTELLSCEWQDGIFTVASRPLSTVPPTTVADTNSTVPRF